MPPVVAAVIAIGTAVGAAVGVAVVGAAAFAVGAAVIVGGTMLITKLATPDINQGIADNDGSRQVTARGTIESQKIVYGEALVSGPLAFVGVSGQGNKNLHHVVALAGHQVEAIPEIWLDDKVITDAQIGIGNWVDTGTFAPQGGEGIVKINRYLGTAAQAADTDLVLSFTGYTTSHAGKGIANIATTFVLNDDSQELWDKYAPANIKALVRGRNQVYDPRLDTSPGANPTSATYQAWTDNPALCAIDYLTNTKFGMKISPSKIDWDAVVAAANACDTLVAIPTGATQKRFTANGVLFATDKHQISINKLLSSMNGTLVYTSGVYVVRAGVYEAPTESLTEDDLTGPITVKTSVERSDRFNTCGGVFIDPDKQHKSVEFPKIQLTAALNRDNGEVLEREIDLPFTNSSYMAQRIAHKLVQMSDQQKVISFPCNLSGLRVAVGDRVNVTVDDFGWSNKIFRCMAWAFSDDGGVDLTLAEDDAGSYADPAEIEYTTVTADGVIVDGFPGVPDPQNLVAAPGIQSIDLNWLNPANVSKFDGVILYASPTSAWSGAVEIGRGILTSFKHDLSTSADPIIDGDSRWYWVRAVGTGASGRVFSDRNPDSDVSTVTATAALNQAQLVEWAAVADGSGLRPENNATVGAILSANLTTDGNVRTAAGVQLTDDDVLNSVVITDITQIQLAGTGDILELIGGQPADLQQLGDVAAYAYDADQALNSSILELDAGVVNLTTLLSDITAGVTDVYIQTTAPVAGIDGVPDPIVTSSRWYDSDDNNAPYYWDGATWVSLLDPRIASNASEITSLSSSLATTQTTVGGHTTSIGANATAISVLDTTVIALDGVVTTLSGDYNQFKADYVALDPSAQIQANSDAIDAIDVRVVAAEGTISTSATSITELSTSIQTYNVLEDVGGVPLEFVGGGEIELQDTSSVGGVTGTAVAVLDTRATETERVQTVQSSSIVELTASLANTNANISANATAVSGLTVIVELQGDIVTSTATDLTALTGRVGTTEGDLTQLNSVAIGSTSALVQSHLALTGTVGGNSGAIAQINTVDVTSTSALVQSYLALSATVDSNTGSISQLNTVNVTSTSALVQSFLTLDAEVSGNSGDITQLNTVNVTSTSALVQSFLSVSSTVDGHTSSISTQSTSIDGIEANYGVKIDNNGRITGFGLNSTSATATPFSEFYVIADRFAVVDPASTGSAPIVPFIISGGTISLTGNVVVNGSLIVTGSVTGTQIANNAISSSKIDTILQSDNYSVGSSGWRIQKDGNAEFNGVVLSRQLLVDSGSFSFGTASNTRHTSITQTLQAYITTNTPFSAWGSANKSYIVAVGTGGGITALTTDVNAQPSNILWGFTGTIMPLTAWNGGQNLRIDLRFFTQLTNGYSNMTANWKIYEVT